MLSCCLRHKKRSEASVFHGAHARAAIGVQNGEGTLGLISATYLGAAFKVENPGDDEH
jgi:hypothetical protein